MDILTRRMVASVSLIQSIYWRRVEHRTASLHHWKRTNHATDGRSYREVMGNPYRLSGSVNSRPIVAQLDAASEMN